MSTPLHEAAESNDLERTMCLVRKGADIQKKDAFMRTPLYCAILYSSRDVARYLRGLPVISRGVIHEAAENNDVHELTSLIRSGIHVDIEDDFGRTPLHMAAHCNSIESAEVLLNHGADHSHRDKHGRTPLHKAATGDSYEVALKILGYGACVDTTNNRGHTSLHVAALKNSLRVAGLLINRGADVNINSGLNSMTPLHNTAENDSIDVARLLLQTGSDPSLRTKDGMTFRDCAIRKNATQCLGLIMRRSKI